MTDKDMLVLYCKHASIYLLKSMSTQHASINVLMQVIALLVTLFIESYVHARMQCKADSCSA